MPSIDIFVADAAVASGRYTYDDLATVVAWNGEYGIYDARPAGSLLDTSDPWLPYSPDGMPLDSVLVTTDDHQAFRDFMAALVADLEAEWIDA